MNKHNKNLLWRAFAAEMAIFFTAKAASLRKIYEMAKSMSQYIRTFLDDFFGFIATAAGFDFATLYWNPFCKKNNKLILQNTQLIHKQMH